MQSFLFTSLVHEESSPADSKTIITEHLKESSSMAVNKGMWAPVDPVMEKEMQQTYKNKPTTDQTIIHVISLSIFR